MSRMYSLLLPLQLGAATAVCFARLSAPISLIDSTKKEQWPLITELTPEMRTEFNAVQAGMDQKLGYRQCDVEDKRQKLKMRPVLTLSQLSYVRHDLRIAMAWILQSLPSEHWREERNGGGRLCLREADGNPGNILQVASIKRANYRKEGARGVAECYLVSQLLPQLAVLVSSPFNSQIPSAPPKFPRRIDVRVRQIIDDKFATNESTLAASVRARRLLFEVPRPTVSLNRDSHRPQPPEVYLGSASYFFKDYRAASKNPLSRLRQPRHHRVNFQWLDSQAHRRRVGTAITASPTITTLTRRSTDALHPPQLPKSWTPTHHAAAIPHNMSRAAKAEQSGNLSPVTNTQGPRGWAALLPFPLLSFAPTLVPGPWHGGTSKSPSSVKPYEERVEQGKPSPGTCYLFFSRGQTLGKSHRCGPRLTQTYRAVRYDRYLVCLGDSIHPNHGVSSGSNPLDHQIMASEAVSSTAESGLVTVSLDSQIFLMISHLSQRPVEHPHRMGAQNNIQDPRVTIQISTSQVHLIEKRPSQICRRKEPPSTERQFFRGQENVSIISADADMDPTQALDSTRSKRLNNHHEQKNFNTIKMGNESIPRRCRHTSSLTYGYTHLAKHYGY
ncbi:uncharacterized protein CLUP02_15046 [Colletotrichum lupini]|uniref:Uncharacterized protein n=1 Tax=Colletotrichum lupini TaxID=145971 RepID=A0A9Q8T643_9PEZI|nr:uncharacterized protein CLUP02_15046 [Colletotrichum lupini]UQC89515.1 hypothetical protein CLUP02_15046 [Colletotrichum lupini]